jgi:hypothetical protein
VKWLTAGSDQKTQIYFLLESYPSKEKQEKVQEVLLSTSRVSRVEFAPILAEYDEDTDREIDLAPPC